MLAGAGTTGTALAAHFRAALGGDNDSDDCDSSGDSLADEIQANPAGFHVLIKSAEFPNGALRGQIGPSDGGGD